MGFKELLFVVEQFVTGLKQYANVEHAGNCLTMSELVSDFLLLHNIKTNVINVDVLDDSNKVNHYCLKTDSGLIIDPTCSQFKAMPTVYIGKMPTNYTLKN